MKRKRILLLCLLLVFTVALSPSPQKKKSSKDLPPLYRKWLEEEVVYIITPKEKEVFLQLETDREREIFIEAFWKARDPDPDTPENEFKKEHYRRLAYVNQWFGREGPGAGWRTDMGRVYITLGEPESIDRYENESEIYPVVIWFYQGMGEYGLPDSFNVAFFKQSGMGQYMLYTPVKYGPHALLTHYQGDPGDNLAAYTKLMDIEPLVAEISMTLIPEEAAHIQSPSIASEVLVTGKIPSAPYQKVKDSYAQKLLMYKDIIDVDYTANYIESDTFAEVIRDKSGISFVHYLIEPKKLTFEQIGDKFRTRLEINGRVADPAGKLVYQYDRSVPIEFDQEQFNNIKTKLFSFQDMFPLVEGNYKFTILFKNTVSKEFTSAEKDLSVSNATGLRFSQLVLANRVLRNSEYSGKSKPFLIDDVQLVPSPRNDFSPSDRLYLYFQVLGLTDKLKENGLLEYSILKEGEKVFSTTKSIKDFHDKMNFLEEFPLTNLATAYYKIRVSLLDRNRNELLFEQGNFFISYLPSLPRPWVLSIPLPPSDDPLFANILGNQFLNKNDLGKARRLLGEAYQKNPSSKQFALDFCRVLFLNKEYQKVKEVASPFLRGQEKYEFLAVVGQSSQVLGELAEAISYYKEYLAHYGTNIQILNSIGECYYQLGDSQEALVAWEKSLELNPKQEKIKKMVDSIKQKK
jgi:GWxTD domain-containing protein